MPNNKSNSNSSLRDWLYGEHYPDAFLDVPRPLRQSRVATLGDYIEHLREVDNQSNKRDEPSEPCIACEPNKRSESSFQHICPNNPILSCNCADPKFCAEQPNDNGWIKCPDSGKLCSVIDCPDGCKGDKHASNDGFADNIEYAHINEQPATERKDDSSRGWPCVVVGDIRETRPDTTERFRGTVPGAELTADNTDAGQNNDGTYVSTNH